MKRIKAACLEQTVHFLLKDDLPHEMAVQAVRAEYEHYQNQMRRSRTRFRILEEQEQPDGSLVVKLKKQYKRARHIVRAKLVHRVEGLVKVDFREKHTYQHGKQVCRYRQPVECGEHSQRPAEIFRL